MNPKKIARKLFWRRGAIIAALAAFAAVMLFTGLVSLLLDIRYNVGDPAAEDAVVLFQAEQSTDEWIGEYRNQRRLEIAAGRTNAKVTFEDVPKLAEQFGIKEVYLADVAKIKEIRTQSEAGGTVEVYSMPEKFLAGNRAGDDLGDTLNYAVKSGALPKNGAREAVLSEQAAVAYGIDPDNWEGSTITVDGTVYSVVGVSSEVKILGLKLGSARKAFLSYEEGSDRGVYRYSADTYEAFCERQKAYYAGTETPEREIDTVVFTGTGAAEEMTDYLVQQYPGTKVYSGILYETVDRAAARGLILYMILMLLLPAAMTGAFVNGILSPSEKKCYRTLADYKAEEKEAIRKSFRMNYIGLWLLCALIGAAVIALFARFGLRTRTIVILAVYVLVVTGFGIFVFLSDGRFSKAPKRR